MRHVHIGNIVIEDPRAVEKGHVMIWVEVRNSSTGTLLEVPLLRTHDPFLFRYHEVLNINNQPGWERCREYDAWGGHHIHC
jgi:hypothetical protein